MMNYRPFIGAVLCILTILCSCQKQEEDCRETGSPGVPAWFPEVPEPEDNRYSPERWELGKRLFFDPALSLHQTVSCGSCHIPEYAFSDPMVVSTGDLGALGVNNTPPLFNLAWHPYYTRAGGVPTLEMQVSVPLQEHHELNLNMVELVDRLRQIPGYNEAAMLAYSRSIDAWVITRALANFERTLISGNSRYDEAVFSGKPWLLSEAEQRGKELFFSERTSCSSCHGGFNFTNYAFENNGLYLNYADSGRMRLTHLEQDRARFKVPSLRNIGLTAPYMHDGSMSDLSEVIDHYNSGGANHPNKNELIRPLGLSEQEKSDLIQFLLTLSDIHFVTNPQFRPE